MRELYWIPGVGFLLIVITVLIVPNKVVWEDELTSLYFLIYSVFIHVPALVLMALWLFISMVL